VDIRDFLKKKKKKKTFKKHTDLQKITWCLTTDGP